MAKKKNTLGIIDFEKKGNVVRFYIGDTSKNYYGDDWDDRPYEHNAGRVYSNFIEHYVDVAFSYDTSVLEAGDDWRYNGNSPFCKNDMRERKVPCLIIVPKENLPYEGCETVFSEELGNDNNIKLFFGDKLEFLEKEDKIIITKPVKTCVNFDSICVGAKNSD